MDSRWAALAVRSHLRGVGLYRGDVRRGDADLFARERVIFEALERELLADTHRLLYNYHTTAAFSGEWEEDQHAKEHERLAHNNYNRFGQHTLPWHKWKTDGESLHETYVRMRDEFRADPQKRQRWQQLKDELDTAVKVSRDASLAEEDQVERVRTRQEQFKQDWMRPRGRRRRRG